MSAAWLVCSYLIRTLKIPSLWGMRLSMGATAFALLMLAEFALSVGLFGSSPTGYFEQYRSWPKLIGLGGQIVFACFPILQARNHNIRPRDSKES